MQSKLKMEESKDERTGRNQKDLTEYTDKPKNWYTLISK